MKTIVYDFWGPWCLPCRTFLPTFEEWARKYGDKAEFVKVHVGENEEMATRFNIAHIPTVIVTHDGEEVARVGIPKEVYIAHILDGLSQPRANERR